MTNARPHSGPVRAGRIAATLLLAAGLAGCGVTRGESSRDLLMIFPNSPGGGYDQTGREAVQVMEDEEITGGSFTVDNIVGAGGAGAMTSLMGRAGDEHTMMTVGPGVVGSTYSFASEYDVADGTPLAQLMSEPEAILVAADSPYQTVDDFAEAWAADPASIPIGGGPLTSALLGGKIGVGFSGLAEFAGYVESGELRVLAVSGEERYPDGIFAEVPTLTESDIDLVFLNWRGVLAPPDISEERTQELIGYLETMHDSQGWQDALDEYGWTDDFKIGDDFAQFIDEQDQRVAPRWRSRCCCRSPTASTSPSRW